MASTCISPIKARVMRLVKVDVCGNPITGAGSVIVSDGFIKVQADPQYEDGVETIVKNANGDLCVNEKDANTLKRVDLTIDFCKVDPDAIAIITGERILTTGSPVTGTGMAFGEGLLVSRFSLEVWQPIAGQSGCSASGQQLFVYWAFPNVGNPKVGGLVFENGPLTFTATGDTKAAAASWGDGPGTGAQWLNGNTIATDEHWAFNVTTVPPPTAACGASALS
jgi:hypothetical protein